jgi:hypothetical protein
MEARKAPCRQHYTAAKLQVSTSRFKAAAENVTDAEHTQISFPGKYWSRNFTLTQAGSALLKADPNDPYGFTVATSAPRALAMA